jgi:hypothetical protein
VSQPQPTYADWIPSFFYNPLSAVEFHYDLDGVYELDEVKQKIPRYVQADDDILTQFMDGNEIANRLAKANNFDDVIALRDAMSGLEESRNSNTPDSRLPSP